MLKPGDVVRQELNSGWHFRQEGSQEWMPADVPGTVHTDLLSNKKINDPFFRANEQELQWISDRNWEYTLAFDLGEALLEKPFTEMVFDGLDTYAMVFLNGTGIGSTNNMFHDWRFDVKALLREKGNELVVRFQSPLVVEAGITSDVHPLLPAVNDQARGTSSYSRKAPFHYGWDWGPCLITMGIWRPVGLVAWDTLRIEAMAIEQLSLSESTAELKVSADVQSACAQTVSLTLRCDGAKTVDRDLHLSPGRQKIELPLEILSPKRWWPAGYGDHPLYTVELNCSTGGENRKMTKRIGLRTIELNRDKSGDGEQFVIRVNDTAVFCKGANWVPADSFTTRIDRERYRYLIESAVDANMNMLRIWGGGIYEPAPFYEICDELGVLVWQDFMFSCSMYPGNPAYLESVEVEARYQVNRLKHHPSIVLWCGNNEIESGWFHWGWNKEQPAERWGDYEKLFYQLLPRVCGEEDPSRPYWPCSPTSDPHKLDEPEDQSRGDIHYWQVWHGKKPFKSYEDQFVRFMSEYGFQSFPDFESVQRYTVESDHDILSPVMKAHQRNGRGNELIRHYMEQYYRLPEAFPAFLQLSQIQQAHAIKICAEHLRRLMPYCMGSLYWQLNDCWPVASWSSIDYYGKWKALHFYAKRFYAPLLVSSHINAAGGLDIYLISDHPATSKGKLESVLMDVDGQRLTTHQIEVDLPTMSSRIALTIPANQLPAEADQDRTFVYLQLKSDAGLTSENTYYFSDPKNQRLPRPEIDISVEKADNQLLIRLNSVKLVRDCVLSAAGAPGIFSDNAFDLYPGRERQVMFTPATTCSPQSLSAALEWTSLYEMMALGERK